MEREALNDCESAKPSDIAALTQRMENWFVAIRQELNSIKQVVNMIARGRVAGPARVVFLVHHLECWDALAPVHAALSAAADFEPIVVSIPRMMFDTGKFGDEERVHKGLTVQGVAHLRLGMDSREAVAVLRAIAPDVIFRQSPWDEDVPAGFRTDELSFARLCYVPYGMAIARIEAKQFDQHFHRMCWRIFCVTEGERTLLTNWSALGGTNAVVTGYPKFDVLAGTRGRSDAWPIQQSLSVDRPRLRVIWAPHHSIDSNWLGFGTFHENFLEILSAIAADPTLEVVLKPHPALFERCRRNAAIDDKTLDAFLSAWDELPNTAVVGGNDYGALFDSSDVMVTDGISFFSEYMLFDRPLIYLDSGRSVGFNSAAEFLCDGMYFACSWSEVEILLEQFRGIAPHGGVGATHDPLRAARQRIAAALMPYPREAASRIVTSLREGLAEANRWAA